MQLRSVRLQSAIQKITPIVAGPSKKSNCMRFLTRWHRSGDRIALYTASPRETDPGINFALVRDNTTRASAYGLGGG